jgi:hypothetical protein
MIQGQILQQLTDYICDELDLHEYQGVFRFNDEYIITLTNGFSKIVIGLEKNWEHMALSYRSDFKSMSETFEETYPIGEDRSFESLLRICRVFLMSAKLGRV